MVDDFGGEPAHGRVASRQAAWVGDEADDLGAFAAHLGEEAAQHAPRPLERLTGALGAVTSAALVMGLGFWTYDLAMRDLTAVPVVRALEGPARMAPEEPGGEVAEHQGLAVNAIQAAEDESAPERLVLAPSAAPLAEDDLAPDLRQASLEREGVAPAEPFAERPSRATGGIDSLPGTQIMLASADTGAMGGASARVWGGAEIDAQPAAVDPIEAALAEALGMPAPDAGPAVAELGGEGVARSPRPTGRPAAAAVPVAEIVPSALPAGTQLVQIGAFAEADQARAEWAALAGRFAPYLAGKAPVVQPATSDGRQLYRLRAAGFADGADARRLCAALSAEGVECVPVLVH